MAQKLTELKNCIQNAVVNRVVEDFLDVVTPLKQFTEAVLAPEGTPHREQNLADKAQGLEGFSSRAAKTARMVAAGGSAGNKKFNQALLASASQIESLTPQLINAGRIRMTYPESKAAQEHFENLRAQYADSVNKVCVPIENYTIFKDWFYRFVVCVTRALIQPSLSKLPNKPCKNTRYCVKTQFVRISRRRWWTIRQLLLVWLIEF